MMVLLIVDVVRFVLFCFVLFCTVPFGAAAESSRGIVAITRGIKVGS
jgi:hypothetical protein